MGDNAHLFEDQKALGRTIQTLREAKNLTPDSLAKKARIDVRRLERIEAGKGDTSVWRILGTSGYSYGLVSNHVRALAARGVIEPTHIRDAGSSHEIFYLPTAGTQPGVR